MNEQTYRRLAVFASGTGTNFEALVEACRSGKIHSYRGELPAPVEVSLLICDRPGAPVVGKAAAAGVETWVASPDDYPSKEAYEREVLGRLQAVAPDLICLAGYMRLVGPTLLEAYPGRILNIHPSLLPAFPGAHAMRDALDYGVKVFGPTVHIVDSTLDGGPIVAQQAFEYHFTDPAELEELMHRAEHELYPRAINITLARLAGEEREAKRREPDPEPVSKWPVSYRKPKKKNPSAL